MDIILIEPDANDELMFETNILNFTRRMEIARHGFESVTLRLASDYDDIEAVCAKHGIEISAPVRKMVKKFAKERARSAGWRRVLEQGTGALLRQPDQAYGSGRSARACAAGLPWSGGSKFGGSIYRE